MKYSTLFVALLIIGSHTFAATRTRFFPADRNFMAHVTEHDLSGNTDTDSVDLYQIMNVEEQDSMLGKGKSIVSADKDFNLVCSREKKQCHIILNKSAYTEISSAKKHAQFKVIGEAASLLTKKFKLNDRGEAYFMASDKLFKIFGSADVFWFEASGE